MASTSSLTFAELLRRHRLAAGLTQEDLAERTGLSVRGIQDLERGARTTPRAETVRMLADGLGLEDEARATLTAAARPELATPSVPGGVSRRPTLPLAATTLVGREREVAAACALLHRPAGTEGARMLTLTGPGGVGKTRLALAIASELAADFGNDVVWVELAPLHDPGLVPAAVARALGVREDGSMPIAEALAATLADRQLLLVLDNCEHLLPAMPFIGTLLSAGPRLTVLATSRARLRLRGEREMPIPPLAVPSVAKNAKSPLEGMAGIAAVRLFVERALAVAPDFVLTEETAETVGAICRRLDGLPLAIELAAARIKLLPPAALLSRLERRLPLLAGGARDMPARQQTMRDAIAWSYDLLTDAEQALFRRLSVFDGGFALEAVKAISYQLSAISPTGDEAIASTSRLLDSSTPPITHHPSPITLDLVVALIDQSLVRSVDRLSGEPRIALFETIREFGLELLVESGEADAVRDAHAHYYLALAEAAEVGLQGAEQVTWLHRLEGEHDNLRVALHSLAKRGETPPSGGGGHGGEFESALRLAGALWFFWWIRGYYAESRAQFEALVAHPYAAARTVARAKVLNGLGVTALSQGDPARAVAAHEEALSIARQLSDSPGEAFSLVCLGAALMSWDDYLRAETVTRESLAVYRRLGDRWGAQMALSNLAFGALHRGDQQQAEELFTESLGITRALGERWATALTLDNLGWLALERQENQRAQDLFTDALAMMAELGDRRDRPDALVGLARAFQRQGGVEQAITLFDESLAIARETGDQRSIAQTLYWLGHARWRQGDPVRARALVHEARALYEAIGDLIHVAASLEALAILATAQGEREYAARWMGEAQALQERLGIVIPGPDRFDAVASETNGESGRSLTPDQAVTEGQT